MLSETWDLIPTSDMNQILKVRNHTDINPEFSNLLIVKHTFLASEDMLFPDPKTIAFFAGFEDTYLSQFEDELILVASNIHDGYMKFYIYCKDSQIALFKCIDYLKKEPYYQVDFETFVDKEWRKLEELKQSV